MKRALLLTVFATGCATRNYTHYLIEPAPTVNPAFEEEVPDPGPLVDDRVELGDAKALGRGGDGGEASALDWPFYFCLKSSTTPSRV